MNLLELTDKNFEKVVFESNLPVVVDFWADWCGPCKKISPIVEELAEELTGKALVAKVDVDVAVQTGISQNIMGLPTVAVYKQGKRVAELTGTSSKSNLKKMIEDLL